jgi:hypothetical protein
VSVGLDDIDRTLQTFAESCFAAGKNCSLNTLASNEVLDFKSPAALLDAIDKSLDRLYASPVPVHDLPFPAVVTPTDLRTRLFRAMYKIQAWPELADHLGEAFAGNWTKLVNATMTKVEAQAASKPDTGGYSTNIILVCYFLCLFLDST